MLLMGRWLARPKPPGLGAEPLDNNSDMSGADAILGPAAEWAVGLRRHHSMGCKDPDLVALTGTAVCGRGLVNCKQGCCPFRAKGAPRKPKATFTRRKAAVLKA
ncbi:TPA: hypothetical protein ACH3X1_001001 [Trebouxia sp. C0004]